jgi:hypothetical protein
MPNHLLGGWFAFRSTKTRMVRHLKLLTQFSASVTV